jgi:demethylmacrocin O-methyltransferase
MDTLDEIAIRNGTDKATVFTRTYAKPHGYTPHLETFFAPMRDRTIKLLEIGVGGGESIRTWLEYFPNASVVGVDVNHDTNDWDTPKAKTHERYQFCQGSQSCPVFWGCFLADFGDKWDIIIDDGSHVSSDIITTFECLWPHVAPGGIYEIEDLNAAPEANLLLLSKAGQMNSTHWDIASITFAKELCILKKV